MEKQMETKKERNNFEDMDNSILVDGWVENSSRVNEIVERWRDSINKKMQEASI